jgi:hypothetical protein
MRTFQSLHLALTQLNRIIGIIEGCGLKDLDRVEDDEREHYPITHTRNGSLEGAISYEFARQEQHLEVQLNLQETETCDVTIEFKETLGWMTMTIEYPEKCEILGENKWRVNSDLSEEYDVTPFWKHILGDKSTEDGSNLNEIEAFATITKIATRLSKLPK